jgi:branched-chain amino acid transport system substrate-binding protein
MLIPRVALVCVAMLSLMALPMSSQAEDGVTSSAITLGQSAAFTGTPSEEVNAATAGAKLYFEMVNKKGGVNGRKIVLESLDDGFDPKRTVDNTQALLKKGVFSLFLYRGTPTTEAILPLLSQARIPLIAPVSGATSLHEPMNHYVFNVRPKYRTEIAAIVGQIKGMGLSKIAALASNDSFGKDGVTGLNEATAQFGLPAATVFSYERNTVAVEDAVKKIFANSPQAILLICTAKPCDAFIRQYRKLGGNQMIFALSNVNSKSFIEGLNAYSRGLSLTQVFPNIKNSTLPLVKEFLAAQTGDPVLQSYPAFEGYVSAKVLVEGLRKLGNAPTREGLINALEGMNGKDLGGVSLNYSPTSHTGLTYVEITVIGKNGTVIR